MVLGVWWGGVLGVNLLLPIPLVLLGFCLCSLIGEVVTKSCCLLKTQPWHPGVVLVLVQFVGVPIAQ